MIPDDVETITMTRQDYDRHMENLIIENLRFDERIDKAIKYIENNINDLKEDHLFIEFTKEELYILLDILKGSDSNE